MSSDTPQFISRSALKVFSGTLVSRVTGMLRDVAMAFCFGTSPVLAAFLLAYRFVYLMRRLFGESLLHQGFIPHFEKIRANDSKKGALFFRDLFANMAIIIGSLILIGEGVLAFFSSQPAHLSQLLLPGVFFICLFGLSSGLLQTEKTFFLPSISPAVFNLIWMIGIFSVYHYPMDTAISYLALILTFAVMIQFTMTLPKTIGYLRTKLSLKECFTPRLFSKELKEIVRPLLLGMIGVASIQINSAIDTIFARCASLEGPAYLWYAIRLQQFPLSLFVISLSTALLPSLSRSSDPKSLLRFAEKRIFLLIFPCVIGIFVLGASSVNLLFGRGGFGQESIVQTTLCLWGYGLALLPYSFVQILAQGFYAKKDYATPAISFCTSTVLNIALNSFFVFICKLGPMSITLATAVSAFYNIIYLYRKLELRPQITPTIKNAAFATLVAGLVTYLFDRAAFGSQFDFPKTFALQVLTFAIPASVYFVTFFALCKWLKVQEVFQFLKR